MRTRAHHVALATITLFLVGLSGCLDDFGTEEAPSWKTGYSYAFQGSADVRIDAVAKENGAIVDEMHEVEEEQHFAYFLEVLDDDYDAAGEPVYLSGMAMPGLTEAFAEAGIDLPGVWPVGIRHRDLGSMYPQVSVEQTCTNGVCDREMGFTFSPTDDEPTFIAFPIEKGDSWVWEAEEGPLTVVVRSEVEGAEKITTDLGTFTAIRIAVTMGVHGLDEAIDEFRQEAAAEGVEVHALEFSVRGAATMWYSPSHGVVAKSQSTFQEEGHVKVSFGGDTYEETFNARLSAREVLVGARLVPGPERSQANIKQVFLGGEALIDPTGESTPVGGSYQIQLDADKRAVNAADAEEVSFQITATPDLPAGHTVRYDIRGPDGTVVASGEGLSFRHTFDDPGVHVIQVWGVDGDGKAQATDAMVVVADYRVTVPASCMPVGTSLAAPLGCDPVSVPVRNGIRSLDITFTSSSAPVLGGLVLEDAHGNQASGTSSLRMEDFSNFEIDGSDWTVSWEPLVQVAEAGGFTIHLAHGAGASDPAGTTSSYLPAGAAFPQQGGAFFLEQMRSNDWLHAGTDGLPGLLLDLPVA